MKTNPAKLNFQNHKVFDEPAPKLETERKAVEKITVRHPTPSRSMPDLHDPKAGLDPRHQVPGNPEYPSEHQAAFRNNFGEKVKYPKSLHLQVPPNPHHLDSGSHPSEAFGEEVRLVESPTPSIGLWSPPGPSSAVAPSPTRQDSGDATLPYRAPTPSPERTETFGQIGGDPSAGTAGGRPAYNDYNQFYE